MTFLVGTRGSKLSLAQTNWVISELQKENAGSEFAIKTITTKGDTDSRALFTIDQKGIFEKEIDKAVAEKEIDFAVHSLKDCLLYTSPSPRDRTRSRMPSSA